MRLNRASIASIVFALPVLVGCGKDDDASTATSSAADRSMVREDTSIQSKHATSPTLGEAIDWVGDTPRRALKDATVVVHRAYEYHGDSWYEVPATHKVIAVDVEIADYYPGIDLDDFDIINGSSHDSYGSNPQILGLNDDYTQAVERESNILPDDLAPLRRLLLYAIPQEWTSIKLGYWDVVLTPEPTVLAANGPTLAEEAEQ